MLGLQFNQLLGHRFICLARVLGGRDLSHYGWLGLKDGKRSCCLFEHFNIIELLAS